MPLEVDRVRQQVEQFVALARGEQPVARAEPAVSRSGSPVNVVSSGRFAADLLASLGYKATPENIRVINAWVAAEGTKAAFNPLATTQGASGATDFNSVGVKNYTSYEQGVEATVRTLRNGRYEPILQALEAGSSARSVAQAIAASEWGTGDLVLKRLGYGS